MLRTVFVREGMVELKRRTPLASTLLVVLILLPISVQSRTEPREASVEADAWPLAISRLIPAPQSVVVNKQGLRGFRSRVEWRCASMAMPLAMSKGAWPELSGMPSRSATRAGPFS